DGELKEVRRTGSYVLTQPGGAPHTEGGGDVDVIVLFSLRGTTGPLYDVLDATTLAPLETVSFADFKALFEAQQ
ncbi:MAG: regulator, partial [Pseudomonadota bacterium]